VARERAFAMRLRAQRRKPLPASGLRGRLDSRQRVRSSAPGPASTRSSEKGTLRPDSSSTSASRRGVPDCAHKAHGRLRFLLQAPPVADLGQRLDHQGQVAALGREQDS
jgi:hypothetical protein